MNFAGLALVTALTFGGAADAQVKSKFASVEVAVNHGLSAYQSGEFGLALQAFEDESARNSVPALYYRARIYGDNSLSFTDHAKAYTLYQRIANEHIDMDPDDNDLAPFVAKSLTQLALYLKNGVPQHQVKPDHVRAAQYLRYAATFFNEEDAQFEFAKLQLKGDGVPENKGQGVYWLSELSQKGHTGAQAFLADLYWRGQDVPKDPTRALLLITLATENAPASERVWIEDTYQSIFCGAGTGVRRQVQGHVADWRQKYSRPMPVERQDRSGLGQLSAQVARSCSNGEQVGPPRRTETTAGRTGLLSGSSNGATAAIPSQSVPASQPGIQSRIMQGTSAGFGVRDAGAIVSAPR